ncbi:MAG: hypothetical protein GY796_26895 [Chloroflexi bacterium]|nr:hypothetical protein [Chloroflexota bacterium]
MKDLHDQGIMSQFERDAHSFVIRIWKENRENPEQTAVWRGWIRHVQTEKQQYFNDMADISHIVAGYLHQDAELDNVFEPVRKDDLP